MSGCEGGSCSTCGGGDDPDRLPPGMLKRYDIMKKQLPQMKSMMQMGKMASMFSKGGSAR